MFAVLNFFATEGLPGLVTFSTTTNVIYSVLSSLNLFNDWFSSQHRYLFAASALSPVRKAKSGKTNLLDTASVGSTLDTQ